MSPEVQNRVISGPTKMTDVLIKFKKEKKIDQLIFAQALILQKSNWHR